MMLKLRFKKKADADTVFTALREDGSSTTTSIGAYAGFGPVHDLSHYVVETSMGFRNAFLGLLGAGRNVEDFNRESKQWLTEEAMVAEAISGQLSQDAMTGRPLSVEDFNWTVRDVLSRGTVKCAAPELTAEQLSALHARLADLRRRWEAVAVGETLELEF
jgi:hypothetical protein